MKKILAGALVLLASTTMAMAEMTVGVKGTLSISGNTWSKDLEQSMKMSRDYATALGAKDERPAAIVGGGGSVFFRWDFLNLGLSDALGFTLGVQPEVGFHANWGAAEKFSGAGQTGGIKFSYNTLDIPLMIVAGLNINESFKVSLSVGPNFGFAVGKAKMTYSGSFFGGSGTQEYEVKPFLMGLQAGLGLGYNFTKNHGLILDARFLTDFMDLKDTDTPAPLPYTRRMGALISLGYAFTF